MCCCNARNSNHAAISWWAPRCKNKVAAAMSRTDRSSAGKLFLFIASSRCHRAHFRLPPISYTHTQCHTTTLIFAVYWFSVLLPGAKSKQFFSPLISLCKNLFFVWNFFIVVFMFFSCVNVILYVRYELWFDLIIFYYCGIFLLSRYMVLHKNISM